MISFKNEGIQKAMGNQFKGRNLEKEIQFNDGYYKIYSEILHKNPELRILICKLYNKCDIIAYSNGGTIYFQPSIGVYDFFGEFKCLYEYMKVRSNIDICYAHIKNYINSVKGNYDVCIM